MLQFWGGLNRKTQRRRPHGDMLQFLPPRAPSPQVFPWLFMGGRLENVTMPMLHFYPTPHNVYISRGV